MSHVVVGKNKDKDTAIVRGVYSCNFNASSALHQYEKRLKYDSSDDSGWWRGGQLSLPTVATATLLVFIISN